MDEILFYLPGTADNLLFLTLAVLVLLIITGIYGYLSAHSPTRPDSAQKICWEWPALSLIALTILFLWFGQPLSMDRISGNQNIRPEEFVILISQFLTGMIVLGAAAASILSSDLRWSLTAAVVSFLTSGLLFLQADILPLVLLCWLILGGTVLLFLYQGISEHGQDADCGDSEGPFREPFLSCVVCGLLLCSCLWVVHREWGPETKHAIETTQTASIGSSILAQQLLTAHWPTFILLMVFVAVSFVGVSRLTANEKTASVASDIITRNNLGELK